MAVKEAVSKTLHFKARILTAYYNPCILNQRNGKVLYYMQKCERNITGFHH